MKVVDLLSDTTYCEQAVQQLDQLLGNSDQLPVKPAQIYGLRQIAHQEPRKVQEFANHQRERADKRNQKEASAFWTLVANLCSNSSSNWSVEGEGHDHLPEKLKNIPPKRKGMTHEEQTRRNELIKCRRKWLEQWENEHIPAFFDRFCTDALYRSGKQKNSEKE